MAPGHDLAKIRRQFVEKIGAVAQSEGMPRIAGRLFALLIFEGRWFSFGELADVLEVSRGSVSSNVRLLENLGVIKRASRPGDRQDYFHLADNPYANLLAGAATRAKAARREIEDTITDLPGSQAETLERLRSFAQFYGALQVSVSRAVEDIQE
ncbi:MAG: MarR family transcriptional regulator [Paracoccaceae bacterium]